MFERSPNDDRVALDKEGVTKPYSVFGCCVRNSSLRWGCPTGGSPTACAARTGARCRTGGVFGSTIARTACTGPRGCPTIAYPHCNRSASDDHAGRADLPAFRAHRYVSQATQPNMDITLDMSGEEISTSLSDVRVCGRQKGRILWNSESQEHPYYATQRTGLATEG